MMIKNPTTKNFEDAIIVGILKAFGISYRPIRDSFTHRVTFEVTGDVDATLAKIYRNEPVGALDVLQAVKSARQAIFSLKGNGYACRSKHEK